MKLLCLVSSAGQVFLETVPASAVLSVLQSWPGGAVGVVGADRGLASSSCKRRPGLRRKEAKRETECAKGWLVR